LAKPYLPGNFFPFTKNVGVKAILLWLTHVYDAGENTSIGVNIEPAGF